LWVQVGESELFEIIYRCDPARQSQRQSPADPSDALRHLEEGNRAFVNLASGTPEGSRVVYFDLADLGIAGGTSAPIQKPYAVVLGCSDARVPIELIFDKACNELFVVRVAGNVLGEQQLGSIDYAVDNLGGNLKLLVTLGHTGCGAVTAAVDAFLRPSEYLGLLSSRNVRSIVNDLFPAVRGAAAAMATSWGDEVTKMPGYRNALIECAVVLNAAISASILREEFSAPAKGLRVVFGVYDLVSRRVQIPRATHDEGAASVRLIEAPANRDEFRDIAGEVAGSSLIRQLLGI
jgi:carbonic anhydrase